MRGREQIFDGEWAVRSARNASRSLRVCVWAGRGEWKCAGEGDGFRRGMGCEVGGFNALSPQPLARTRIIIIRPPCPRREIAAMGPKDALCEHPSPAE